METFTTPMMKQYAAIKKQYQECLLFYRMGDFYELFMEDAYIGSQILNITLTSRPKGKDGRIPMAGVPYHAVDAYLGKLTKAGYKVAICEQVSLPNKHGIVEREVIRVVTPGTVLDEKVLEKKANNYIVSITVSENAVGLSVADISTGYFAATEIECDAVEKTIQEELAKLHPAECIVDDVLYNTPDFLKALRIEKEMSVFPFVKWHSYATNGKTFLKNHFGTITLEGFGIEKRTLAIESAAALLGYLKETQKRELSHIKKISSFAKEDGLHLDRATVINLELFSTIREHDTKGTLLATLDQTLTAMGGRLLKQWMKIPLTQKAHIEERLTAVEQLVTHAELRKTIREKLKEIPDIERIFSRLSVHLGNGRDMVSIKNALQIALSVKKDAAKCSSPLLQLCDKEGEKKVKRVIEHIETTLVDEPPILLKDGGLIREGVNSQLDTLRKKIKKSKNWIVTLEAKEKERTGIGSLKVRYNKVFGFYIEISKSNLHLIPNNYMRKQTLVNGERFITKELKEQEEIILSAEEKIHQLEYELFLVLLREVTKEAATIQMFAQRIGVIDCIANFADISEKEQYIRPKLLYSGEIRIKQGRHPVVEKLLPSPFIPNDIVLDNINQQLLLITGPNMAGKSVFLRQVALIVLMAQMGCFVPAQSAHISIIDQIFVRSGASDVITSGLSTFMVEMVETAHILNNATKQSLIIMDEIGRGTSTYDGISIAWAVAEYLVTHMTPSPKTLFATHYHELQKLEEIYPTKIKNFHMGVAQNQEEPVFLHTLLPGGASHSFGVAVAKLAGIPKPVIDRAQEMLQQMEQKDTNVKLPVQRTSSEQLLFEHMLQKEITAIDISTITPLEAINILAELKEKIKLVKETQQKSFIEAD